MLKNFYYDDYDPNVEFNLRKQIENKTIEIQTSGMCLLSFPCQHNTKIYIDGNLAVSGRMSGVMIYHLAQRYNVTISNHFDEYANMPVPTEDPITNYTPLSIDTGNLCLIGKKLPNGITECKHYIKIFENGKAVSKKRLLPASDILKLYKHHKVKIPDHFAKFNIE